MRSPNLALAYTEEQKIEQIKDLLVGLDELAAYTGSRPHQRWEFKLATSVYVEFWRLTRKLRGESLERKYMEPRTKQSFSAFIPFPLFLLFKQLNQELRKKVPAQFKDDFSMTAWGNLATAKIIIPALHERILLADLDADFRSAVNADKDKYTMTAWITAAIDKNIIPALSESIQQADADLNERSEAA